MKTFGETFREILRRQNLTQVDAARLLAISQSVVSRYCSLEEPPRPRILRSISTCLGVTVAELTGETFLPKGEGRKSQMIPIIRADPFTDALMGGMKDLKRRWKKNPQQHDIIKHLVAALFPKERARIVAWLDQDKN